MSAGILNKLFFHEKDYEVIEFLGGGSFGQVYLVRCCDGKELALKIQKPNKYNYFGVKEIKNFLSEISTLASVSHSTIMKFYGFSFSNLNPRLYMLMEYVPGDLKMMLNDYENGEEDIDNTLVMKILIGIIAGLTTLHSRNIIHRDLKPENILLDDDGLPKIGDFGYARFVPNAQKEYLLTDNVGSESWMAPEVFCGDKYSAKCDIYSFAVIAYQLILKKCSVWEGFKSMQEIVVQKKRMNFPRNFPKVWKDLIESGWSSNPDERPTSLEILKELGDDRYMLPEVDVEEVRDYYERVVSETNLVIQENKIIDEDPVDCLELGMKLIDIDETGKGEILGKIFEAIQYQISGIVEWGCYSEILDILCRPSIVAGREYIERAAINRIPEANYLLGLIYLAEGNLKQGQINIGYAAADGCIAAEQLYEIIKDFKASEKQTFTNKIGESMGFFKEEIASSIQVNSRRY